MLADAAPGETSGRRLSSTGCAAVDRLVAARRAHLEEVFGQWTMDEQRELATLLHRLTRELVSDRQSGGEVGVS
jgi:hypothetical protein